MFTIPFLLQSSSVSSDSSFEELRKLATVDEGSERSSSAPGTTPSTQVLASKLTHSPHDSVSSNKGKNVSSSASKRSEKTEDEELDELLRMLQEETGALESEENQVFTLKPPVASSLASNQDRGLQSTVQDEAPSGNESTSSSPIKPPDHSVVNYDHSPRVFRSTRCGSMPSMVVPEVCEMGESDSSHIQDEKRPRKLGRKNRTVSESGRFLDHQQAVKDDDDLVASVSTSRVDAWIREQNKLNSNNNLPGKCSLDDSVLTNSSHDVSLQGTEDSLATNSTTMTSGQSHTRDAPPASSVSVAARRQAFEGTVAPQKPWFNSPQKKQNGSALASSSPFSSVSYLSTDNSLNGAEKGVRASPPTTRPREAKHRPTSNLSRSDSGYTSREHMGLDSTQFPGGLKTKSSVSPRLTHIEFRRSPTQPATSSASAVRRAEFFPHAADVHPPCGRLTHSRSIGPDQFGGDVEGSGQLHQEQQESAGIQPESRPSSAGSIHPPPAPPLHSDYHRNDRSYRHAQQMQPRREVWPSAHPFHTPVFPHTSHVSSSARNLCYYTPAYPHFPHYYHQYPQQQEHLHYQQPVDDHYQGQQRYYNTVQRQKVHKPSPSSFIDQLNHMSHRNAAKSAPLIVDSREAKLAHAFNGRVPPGVPIEAGDAQRQIPQVYPSRWRRNMVSCGEPCTYYTRRREVCYNSYVMYTYERIYSRCLIQHEDGYSVQNSSGSKCSVHCRASHAEIPIPVYMSYVYMCRPLIVCSLALQVEAGTMQLLLSPQGM